MREASNRFLATVFGLVLIHAGGLTPVAAGELPGLRLTLEHGQFFPKDSVNPGLSQEPAEELDGPRDLGWIAGSFEFAPRHKVNFDYANLAGDRSPGLDLHREFAYTLLRPGGESERDPDLRVYKVDYSYSFLRDRKWDLWGSLGLQVLDLDLGKQGSELQAGSATPDRRRTPLPVVGLGGELNLSPNWNLKGGVRYFDGGLGEWGGNGLDAKLSVEYNAFDRMGIGLSYDFVNIGLNQSRAGAQDYYGLRYDGVGIYARFSLD